MKALRGRAVDTLFSSTYILSAMPIPIKRLVIVSIHIDRGARAVPLGAASIAALVQARHGDRVKPIILDFFLDQDIALCVAAIKELQPDILAFSIYLWNRRKSIEIARRIKTELPDLPIFAGGPEVTADWHRLGEAYPGCFDLFLPGEGEGSILQGLDMLLAGRPGTSVLFPQSVDLAVLPSPYLDGTLDPTAYTGLLWELSRGCPFRCHFCFESKGSEQVRYFSMERITRELELFAHAGVRELFILDPTFNHNRTRAKKLLRLMQKIAPDIHYNIEVRSEFLDQELAELFSGLSCSLQIGLQSADPKVLRNINRSIKQDDFRRKVLFLHEAEVVYGFDLIYGLPGDSLEGFLASIDFAFSMVPNHIDIFPLAVLPGTILYDQADSFGLVRDSDDPYLVHASSDFHSEDMAVASRIASAIDLFYNQGNAVPWFDIIIERLGINPSRFFLDFSLWLEGKISDGHDQAMSEVQQIYLLKLFTDRGLQAEGEVVHDIIEIFALWDRIDEATSGNVPELSGFFHFSPSQLFEYLEEGVRDLGELAFFLPRVEKTILVSSSEGVLLFQE